MVAAAVVVFTSMYIRRYELVQVQLVYDAFEKTRPLIIVVCCSSFSLTRKILPAKFVATLWEGLWKMHNTWQLR